MPIKKGGNKENVLVTFDKVTLKRLDNYNETYAPNLSRSQLIMKFIVDTLAKKAGSDGK